MGDNGLDFSKAVPINQGTAAPDSGLDFSKAQPIDSSLDFSKAQPISNHPSGSGYPEPTIPGNIQWYGREQVPTDSIHPGTHGTVYSESREEDGQEVLYPRIYDGKLHSSDEAWKHYKQTGQHMGKFKNAADADAYGQKYHEDAARGLYDKPASDAQSSPSLRDSVDSALDTSDTRQSAATRFAKGAVSIPVGAAEQAYDLATATPKDDFESAMVGSLPDMVGKGALLAKRMFYDPSEQAWNDVHQRAQQTLTRLNAAVQSGSITPERAKEIESSVKKYETAGKAMASIPIFGPMGLGMGKHVNDTGDVAGIMGQLTSIAIAPEIAKRVGPVISKAADTVKTALTPDAEAALAKAKAAVHSDFQKAIPPSKSAPYSPEDLDAARPHLEDQHEIETIKEPLDVRDASDSSISRIERRVGDYIAENPKDLIRTSPLEAAKAALSKSVRSDFVEKGLKELEPYSLDEPITLEKADRIRRQLNNENNGVMDKNKYLRSTARDIDPGFAAREAAVDALREGIYNQLEERGIEGVDQLRHDEGSLIKIRDAAQNQIYNGEKQVAKTGASGTGRKVLRNVTKAGITGVGAGIGALVYGEPGAAVGGLVTSPLANLAGDLILPDNLTRSQLLERSFGKKITNGAEFPDIPPRPKIRGLLNPKPTELGPSTNTNPLSEPQRAAPDTRAARKGLLLNKPKPAITAAGFNEPAGEPVGTPVGSSDTKTSFQAPGIIDPANNLTETEDKPYFSNATGPQFTGSELGQIVKIGKEHWAWNGEEWKRLGKK